MSTTQNTKAAAQGGAMQVPGLLVLAVGLGAAFLFRQQPTSPAVEPRAASVQPVPIATPPIAAVESAPTRLLGYVEASPEVGVAAQPSARTAGRVDRTAAWAEVPAPAAAALPPTMPPFQLEPSPATRMPVQTAQGLNPPLARMRPYSQAVEAAGPGDVLSTTPANAARRHKVRDGDTLGGLAERYYGDPRRYTDIFLENRDVLRSPDVLPLGVELKIPGYDPATAPAGPVPPPAARLVPQIKLRNP